MSKRTTEKIAAARRAADVLEHLRHPLEANAIRSLCRANVSLAVTCSELHTDNMELRRQLDEPDTSDEFHQYDPGPSKEGKGF